MIHVAGSRFIRCGVDGISCSNLQLEHFDEEIYLHLPVYRDTILISPLLLTLIQSWISYPFSLAEPSDWFSQAQQTHYTYVSSRFELWLWYLPFAVALDDMNELRNGRLKRQEILWGIVIIPFVMQPDWFNRFLKFIDIYFFISAEYITE